ncbi:hypothetical protein K0G46_11340, partial [Phocaeicola vulgatus]|uniref:hypothetical protein n=1 Tax=Phocaeicola vulgatus TaxID=821 RepID=UPI001F386319
KFFTPYLIFLFNLFPHFLLFTPISHSLYSISLSALLEAVKLDAGLYGKGDAAKLPIRGRTFKHFGIKITCWQN